MSCIRMPINIRQIKQHLCKGWLNVTSVSSAAEHHAFLANSIDRNCGKDKDCNKEYQSV